MKTNNPLSKYGEGVNSPSFSGRNVPLFPTMLVTMSKGSGTPTEPHHTPSPEAPQSPQHDLSSSIHPPVTTVTIPTTSTLPHDSPLRVTSLADDEGSLQHKLNELTDLCTRLQRQQTEMASKITAQDLEIASLKAIIKMLEDNDGEGVEPSGEDATIKGRSLETGEEAASILTSEVQLSVPPAAEVATVSISPVGEIPTVSVPTGNPIFTTTTVATPYSRRKCKKKMVESETPKKKKIEDFVPIGSKEEGERFKRKELRLEQDSAKKVKTSEEVSKEDLKKMMQLVPVEEVYVEALQVKHPIIYWEIHTEGQRSYWKIIRLGGSTTSYQFFVDMLKHFDRKDLNQIWVLVKETLNIRQATSDKEKELDS
nr:hypothetical protein [Tanacetum cinerariifolium]